MRRREPPRALTDQAFVDGGGSPFEGQQRPTCDAKLVTVRGNQAVAPNFNLFTQVPLPTHFWGLTINDLGLSNDKHQLGYGEAQPLPHVPMGIYDWAGRLVDTVETDFNGMYEAIEPSTGTFNCPLPAGPCPNMYRFVGNDPGQPGHAQPEVQPAVPHDRDQLPGLARSLHGDRHGTDPGRCRSRSLPAASQVNPVDCSPASGQAQTCRSSRPAGAAAPSTSPPRHAVTITGRGFGAHARHRCSHDHPGHGTARPAGHPDLGYVPSWSDTSITVRLSRSRCGQYRLAVTRPGPAVTNGVSILQRGVGLGLTATTRSSSTSTGRQGSPPSA